jgi:hypothetical protein
MAFFTASSLVGTYIASKPFFIRALTAFWHRYTSAGFLRKRKSPGCDRGTGIVKQGCYQTPEEKSDKEWLLQQRLLT